MILYETFSNRETLMMCFNQPILQLYQAHKNLLEKVQAGLLIQPLIILGAFRAQSKASAWGTSLLT